MTIQRTDPIPPEFPTHAYSDAWRTQYAFGPQIQHRPSPDRSPAASSDKVRGPEPATAKGHSPSRHDAPDPAEHRDETTLRLYDPDAIHLQDPYAVEDMVGPPIFHDQDTLIALKNGSPLRFLKHADESMIERLTALDGQAPHLSKVTDLISRQLHLSIATNTPISLPPILLLGKAGIGKTWYLRQIASILNVPFRRTNFNATTLGEYFQGSHQNWRNASHGVVAKTLIEEAYANPLFLIDEFDKAPHISAASDPYRPFYTLLEPEAASSFIDEFLQIPFRADKILWIATANSTDIFPDPIMDRLLVLEVPPLSRDQTMIIAREIYADINTAHNATFSQDLPEECCEFLQETSPRRARLILTAAIAYAAAAGRTRLDRQDLMKSQDLLTRQTATRAGFIR